MTNKEIAERLRGIVNYNLHSSNIKALADELDPPRPKAGTAVWYRKIGTVDFYHGVVANITHGQGVYGPRGWYAWEEIEWKPAHILAPDEVVISKQWALVDAEAKLKEAIAEAERMEANQ